MICLSQILHVARVASYQLDHKKSHDSPKVVCSFAKDTPALVRNYGQDQKWVKGWVVKATGPVSYLVRLQNGKVIRRNQDQIRSRTEQSSATTVNSSEQFDSNESLLLLQQVHLFLLHLQFYCVVTHKEHTVFQLDYMIPFTLDSNCHAYSFFFVSCV